MEGTISQYELNHQEQKRLKTEELMREEEYDRPEIMFRSPAPARDVEPLCFS